MDADFPGIINYIWRRQPGEFSFLSHRRSGRWKDYALPAEWPVVSDVIDDVQDLFFTPLTFIEPHRSNEAAAGSRVLFADLDPVDPSTLSLPPSMAWETSPGSFQALWLVGDTMGYSLFANLNRRLTVLTGADPGGWMGSKLLRVPGSTNHKYDPPRPGRLLSWNPDLVYWTDELDGRFPVIPNRPNVGADPSPDLIPEAEYAQYVNDRWQSLTLRGRAMLMKTKVPDRSLHIVRTIHELLSTGMSMNTVFTLIWWRPWNKWRLQDKPEQLWAEVQRAKFKLID
jgi:hypothetical protein